MNDVDASNSFRIVTKDQRQMQSAPTSFNGSKNPNPALDIKIDPLPDQNDSDDEGCGSEEVLERKKKR